jgi:hypothetical protein
MKTAVEWFYQRILAKDIKAVFEQAKEMEKEQMEEIREMLVQGALTNMSCASAVVEFDRLTKQQEQ